MNEKYLIGAAIGVVVGIIIAKNMSAPQKAPPLPTRVPGGTLPTIPQQAIAGRRRIIYVGDIRPTYHMPAWYAY